MIAILLLIFEIRNVADYRVTRGLSLQNLKDPSITVSQPVPITIYCPIPEHYDLKS